MKTVELRPRLYKVKPGSMTLSRYVGMIVEGHIDLEYGCVKVDCIDPETGESISAIVNSPYELLALLSVIPRTRNP